jgi:chromosome segregation ATPase
MSTDLDDVRDLLMSAARYAESAHRGLDRLEIAQERSQLHIEQLTMRMDRVEAQLEELRATVSELRATVSELSTEVGRVMLGMELLSQQAEQDRNQAAIDRAEFRSTVEQLLRVLTQQFNGNGET